MIRSVRPAACAFQRLVNAPRKSDDLILSARANGSVTQALIILFACDGGLDVRTYKDAKMIAKALRGLLAARGVSLTHSECLEIVAQQFGFAEWNILAAKLAIEVTNRAIARPDFTLQPAIPVLRISSLGAAKTFYVDFLGFQLDWGGEEDSSYAQITRSDTTLHLDAQSPVSGPVAMLVRMDGLNALHAELSQKADMFVPGAIDFTPWDSRVFQVVDPFGNIIRFWENNPPGVAGPLQQHS